MVFKVLHGKDLTLTTATSLSTNTALTGVPQANIAQTIRTPHLTVCIERLHAMRSLCELCMVRQCRLMIAKVGSVAF
jgi:hypothetical protein